MSTTNRTKRLLAGVALLLAGAGVGAAIGVTGSASATTDAVTDGVTRAADRLDPTNSIRSDEKLLTGSSASKVEAAALARYPGATVQRVETDSDGVYEAHIVTAAGDEVTVAVDEDFAVTGTSTGGHGGHGGHGRHHGGPSDGDDDGPDSGTDSGTDSGATTGSGA